MPMPSPLRLPLPRRFVILGLSAGSVYLFLHTFAPSALPPVLTPHLQHHEPDAPYFSPGKWLPPILDPNTPSRPPEYDEDGSCLFLSPFDALSPAEKARAEKLVLDEVSTGVIRARAPPGPTDADPDFDDEFSAGSNATSAHFSGLTHPILGLLRDGEIKWRDLVAGQSRTLEQAVQTYRDRWGRPPPQGFDHW